jgi:hypothetical protein
MKQETNFKKIFLIIMVISLSISALIGIIIFLFGNFSDTEYKLLFTTLAIGGYSLTGMCCSVFYEKNRSAGAVKIAQLGMALSILGFIYTVLVIWSLFNFDNFDNSWKILATFIILSISLAHICLLLLIASLKGFVVISVLATIISISIVALLLIWPIWVGSEPDLFYFRIVGVFAILDVLGTIVTPILNKVFSVKK